MKNYQQFIKEYVEKSQLNSLETKLDNIWNKLGVDIEFSKHFLERVNDERNNPAITLDELEKIFVDSFAKYGKEISKTKHKEIEFVLNDIMTKLNVPAIVSWNRERKMLELVAKTVMRKSNFQTTNNKLKV